MDRTRAGQRGHADRRLEEGEQQTQLAQVGRISALVQVAARAARRTDSPSYAGATNVPNIAASARNWLSDQPAGGTVSATDDDVNAGQDELEIRSR